MDFIPSVNNMPYLIISVVISYCLWFLISILAITGFVSLTSWTYVSIFLSLPIVYFISVLIYVGY